MVEVTVTIVLETRSALLVRNADDVESWLAKSQIQWLTGKVGETGTIEMPDWLAEDKGLV